MALTLTIDIPRNASPIVLQQLLDWASRLNGSAPADLTPSPISVSNGAAVEVPAAVETVQAPTNGVAEQTISASAPVVPKATKTVKAPKAAEPVQPAEEPYQLGVGEFRRAPGLKGRPSAAEKKAWEDAAAAIAAAAEAARNPAIEPPIGVNRSLADVSAPKPAAPQPVQVQQPAMPALPEPPAASGMITKEDLEDCYSAARAHDPQGVRALMQALQWSDGSPKQPWYAPVSVPAAQYERLVNELAALLPQQG